jgi:hypothetical protein
MGIYPKKLGMALARGFYDCGEGNYLPEGLYNWW